MTITLPKNWHTLLKDELSKPYIDELKNFLAEEVEAGAVIYPPLNQVFEALYTTPYEDVRVVIMGQDPYHNPNQAHGLSFSVPEGMKPPPSLINIYKEIARDLGRELPSGGNLTGWAKQGVLLLNATLTVRKNEPKSHYGRGWEKLTDAILETLLTKQDPLVFVLWGRSAREKLERLNSKIPAHHLILTAAHPSPFSAHLFKGCSHFSQINSALKSWGYPPIDWNRNSP